MAKMKNNYMIIQIGLINLEESYQNVLYQSLKILN